MPIPMYELDNFAIIQALSRKRTRWEEWCAALWRVLGVR